MPRAELLTSASDNARGSDAVLAQMFGGESSSIGVLTLKAADPE